MLIAIQSGGIQIKALTCDLCKVRRFSALSYDLNDPTVELPDGELVIMAIARGWGTAMIETEMHVCPTCFAIARALQIADQDAARRAIDLVTNAARSAMQQVQPPPGRTEAYPAEDTWPDEAKP